MTPGKIPGQRNSLPLALRGSQDSHKGSMFLPPPPTRQSHGSHGFYPQTMSQEVPIGQAELSHTGHQWDYQSTMRAPPSSSRGRAPPSADGNIAETTAAPQAPSDAAELAPQEPLVAAEPAPQEPADVAEPAPQEPADVAEPAPQEPADVAEPAPQEPADVADPAPQAPADAGDPAPQATRSPAAQEPVDALYSPLGEEYIALQRRLITSPESMQRGQERFFRNQERFIIVKCKCSEPVTDYVNSV
ncbi:resuscitation-promoting factor RpfA-like [Bombina bombina]|uniref:resuscitation-promoting factor RpfA-like n=1 Tax=Bombina bombina TaxID=8345 RepID=UPI00235AC7C8|nr:resuscitation-promoting factor RpfA-like [Bombina bombina]XP_053569546.1 resuscitation-promoting factor RpfA-like [Bombina bombina]XP_053569547.1 resuscitation-promoting factor RpfA-like [Bombina bombina]